VQRAAARLYLVEQLLTFLTLGQVTYESNELPLPLEQDLAHRQFHREGAAIVALADDHASHADDVPLAGGEVSIQIAVVLVPIRRGHQHADVASLNLANGESEKALRGRAEGLDHPLLVNDHHRIRDSLKN